MCEFKVIEMNEKPIMDLLHWISTGNLAGVFPGVEKNYVVNTIGKPSGWGSSSFSGDVEDFFDVDMWGYGLWTLYFNDTTLDAITFVPDEQNKLRRNLCNIEDSFFNSMDDAEKILNENGISTLRLAKNYKLRNNDTGEILERRRRLVFPALLAGNNLQTRILFNEDGGMKVIANPFSVRRQGISYERLDPPNSYTIL